MEKHKFCASFCGSAALRTYFFPVAEKSMQKKPRLRLALLKLLSGLIITSRTSQGRLKVNEEILLGLEKAQPPNGRNDQHQILNKKSSSV